MAKYFSVFILLLSITISNFYFFGLKDKSERTPELAQERTQEQIIVEAEPVELKTWKETRYWQYKKADTRKPAVAEKTTKKSTNKTTIVLKGVKYVKIPFKGKHIYVSSDYYTVNGVRKPLSLKQAQKVAHQHGSVLPTREMVDAIWNYADLKLRPQPLKAGPLMTQPVYFLKHNAMIENQIDKRPFDLVAGHKKDIIRPERKGRVTLYGWHRLNGVPIQPPTNVHDDNYGDYANCLRLIKLHS